MVTLDIENEIYIIDPLLPEASEEHEDVQPVPDVEDNVIKDFQRIKAEIDDGHILLINFIGSSSLISLLYFLSSLYFNFAFCILFLFF